MAVYKAHSGEYIYSESSAKLIENRKEKKGPKKSIASRGWMEFQMEGATKKSGDFIYLFFNGREIKAII